MHSLIAFVGGEANPKRSFGAAETLLNPSLIWGFLSSKTLCLCGLLGVYVCVQVS